MGNRFVDFDEMWKESMPEANDAPRVRILGEDITLPAVCPARLMLRGLRGVQAETTLAEQTQEMIKDLVAVYGEGRVERWVDSGMHSGQLADILGHTYQLYTPKRADGDEKNAKAPKAGAKKGTRSKQSSKSGA